MKRLITWLALTGGLAEAAAPPSPTPSPSASPKRPEMIQASPKVIMGTGPVRSAAEPPASGPGRYDGSLSGVKALEIADGRARLLLGGVERVVTPGSVIGTDTVKSITPGRIVLTRVAPDSEGGQALVFVTYDEQGRTRVLVVATKNPMNRAPVEVK
jgi:hypothetical protein